MAEGIKLPSTASRSGCTPVFRTARDMRSRQQNFFDMLENDIGEVDWDTVSLFGRIPRSVVVAIFNDCRHIPGAHASWKTIYEAPVPCAISLLYHTWWFKTLSRGARRRVYNLVRSGVTGLNRIDQILCTVDAFLSSIYISLPRYYIDRGFDSIVKDGRWLFTNCLFGDFNFEARFKASKKLARKYLLADTVSSPEGEENPPKSLNGAPWPWSYGGLVRLRNVIAELDLIDKRSQRRLFAASTFCQTRNQGMATYGMEVKALAKAEEVLTGPSVSVDHSEVHMLVSRVFSRASKDRKLISRSQTAAKISANSNSCLEEGRRTGGKVKAVANIFSIWDGAQYEIDLSSGLSTDRLCEKMGMTVFHRCLQQWRNGTPLERAATLTCRLTSVREPGKARCVTTSSIEHASILQPYSHFFLGILSSSERSRSGVGSARHGWNFISRVNDPDLFGQLGFSTDLETATDFFSWDTARAILEALNERFGIPEWYGKQVIDLLTSPRTVIRPDGSTFTTRKGCLMGDPVTKVLLTVVSEISIESALMERPCKEVSSIVGDDLTIIASDESFYKLVLRNLKRFGMRISWDDTFVSRSYCFFSEEALEIPQAYYDTVEMSSRLKDPTRTPYADAVKGRLLVPVRKNRDDYSYDQRGRINALGHDLEYVRKHPQKYRAFTLACLIQDVQLDVLHMDGTPYFPFAVTSCGRPPISGKYSNFLRFISRHYYGRLNATYQYFISCTLKMVKGETVHNQVGNFVLVNSKHLRDDSWSMDVPRIIPPGLYQRELLVVPRTDFGTWSGIIARIKDLVMPRSEVVAKILSRIRLEAFISGLDPEEYKEFHTRDWLDSTASFGDWSLSDTDLRFFFEVWMEQPWLLRDLRREPIYDREEAEEVIQELHDLKVYFPCFRGDLEEVERVLPPDVSILYDWIKANREAIKASPTAALATVPRDLISDDEVLLAHGILLDIPWAIVITSDLVLLDAISSIRLSRDDNHKTYHLTPEEYILTRGDPCVLYRRIDEVRRVRAHHPLPCVFRLPDESHANYVSRCRRIGCGKRGVDAINAHLIVDTGSLNFYLDSVRAEPRADGKGLDFIQRRVESRKWDKAYTYSASYFQQPRAADFIAAWVAKPRKLSILPRTRLEFLAYDGFRNPIRLHPD